MSYKFNFRAHQSSLDAAAAERNFIRLKTREVRQREMEDAYHKHLVKMVSSDMKSKIVITWVTLSWDIWEEFWKNLLPNFNLFLSIPESHVAATMWIKFHKKVSDGSLFLLMYLCNFVMINFVGFNQLDSRHCPLPT